VAARALGLKTPELASLAGTGPAGVKSALRRAGLGNESAHECWTRLLVSRVLFHALAALEPRPGQVANGAATLEPDRTK